MHLSEYCVHPVCYRYSKLSKKIVQKHWTWMSCSILMCGSKNPCQVTTGNWGFGACWVMACPLVWLPEYWKIFMMPQTPRHTHKQTTEKALFLGPSAFCLTFAHVQTPVTMCGNSKSGHWVSLFRWFWNLDWPIEEECLVWGTEALSRP